MQTHIHYFLFYVYTRLSLKKLSVIHEFVLCAMISATIYSLSYVYKSISSRYHKATH